MSVHVCIQIACEFGSMATNLCRCIQVKVSYRALVESPNSDRGQEVYRDHLACEWICKRDLSGYTVI